MSEYVVYRMFDQSGHALYVGCSENPIGRISSHYHKRGLRPERVAFTYHDTLNDALLVERAEIRRLSPTENVRSTGQRITRAPSGDTTLRVARAVLALGECTSVDVAAFDPEVAAGSASTILCRFRTQGLVTTVRMVAGRGRAAHVVAPTDELREIVEYADRRAERAEAFVATLAGAA